MASHPPVLAQGEGGALPTGIPYSPWLLPLIFTIAGTGYTVSRWYWARGSKGPFSPAKFLKTTAYGMALGVVAFASISAGQAHTITESLLAGGTGIVDPHVFGAAVMGAYLIIVGLASTWKAARGPRGQPAQGAPS